MRIALINPRPQRRGAEIFSRDLARALRRRGHDLFEVYLYPPPADGGLPTGAAEVHLVSGPGRLERLFGWDPRLAHRLRQALTDFRPDVIQVSGGGAVKYAALVARRLPGPPLLVYRNVAEPGKWVKGWRRRWLYSRVVFPRVNAATTVAEEFVPGVERTCANAHVVRHIPRGLDPDGLAVTEDRARTRAALDTPAEAPVALFAGRLSAEKRVDRLLRAFDAAAQQLTDATLWIAGDGPLADELRRQAADLASSKRVRFLGTRDDVGNLLDASDLVALTSDSEGVPGILREAAQIGRAAVATRAGSTSEIVRDGETGLLVDCEDEAGLARALVELLADPERRERMGAAAARSCAAGPSIEASASAHEELYRDALNLLRSGTAA